MQIAKRRMQNKEFVCGMRRTSKQNHLRYLR